MKLTFAALSLAFLGIAPARAGLHLSLETVNELPCQWRGLLPDLRRLRSLANPNVDASRGATLTHSTYTDALLKLETQRGRGNLTPDEWADLGALHLRLGSTEKALEALRIGRLKDPDDYKISSNLATAWQLAGELEKAQSLLEAAVESAPAKWKAAEAAQLKLVKLRRAAKSQNELDALFDGKPTTENLAAAQQLAVWLPADGRLLWQLGELAHAAGDVRTAAGILDGCVSDFAMNSPTLREQRRKFRAEADALDAKNEHPKLSATLFQSARALSRAFDEAKLPKVDAKGVNAVPWLALTETTIARPFKPQFLKYVESLDGKRVSLVGHMRPIESEKGGEVGSFLFTEQPIGCWFCELPDPASVVLVELKGGTEITRNAITVVGVFHVNRTDPEANLFRLSDAKVKIAD